MCGIGGVISFKKESINKEGLKSLSASIKHRGPDGDGEWFDEKSQPMDTVKWHDPTSQFLMCRLDDNNNKTSLLLLLNAGTRAINVSLPKTAQKWQLQITSEPTDKLSHIDKILDISAQSSWVFSTNFEGNDNES